MRIFLVRHGESLGNLDEQVYANFSDENIPLTEWGYEQSREAGVAIREFCQSRNDLAEQCLRVYHSPFLRTTHTKDGVVSMLGKYVGQIIQSDLIKEQNFGIFRTTPNREEQKEKFPTEIAQYNVERSSRGKFFARPPYGETGEEVSKRIATFIAQVESEGSGDVVVVTHGAPYRIFEMLTCNKGISWFQETKNPNNCDVMLLEGDMHNGFSATALHSGKQRPQSLPADYKTAPYSPDCKGAVTSRQPFSA